MNVPAKKLSNAVASTLILSLLALAGCNKTPDAPQQPTTAAPAASATAQAAPYTPPTADQLSQMVAPIALFPDKLVAQVLAGATYPEQITAANQWLAQNPSLKGDALQTAEASQPWDVSVKSLTTFPSVLNQMAGNPQWTKALGDAYVNDPNDVMNAIQALRLRAQQAGNLKNSPQLRVSTITREAPSSSYAAQIPADPDVYAGPEVIPAPPQTIVIEPAQPDVVYVPQYNPAVVYGDPVPVYPGWAYSQPAYTSNNLVTTGVLSFGIGVLVGAAISHHHDTGWHSWGVNWGGPRGGGEHDWHRPAVVYNNQRYVSKSVTVVNHVNNINVTNNNYRTTNNIVNNPARPPVGNPGVNQARPNYAPHGAAMAANPPMQRPGAAMTMPHFTPHDAVPGQRPPAMHAAEAPHMNQFAAGPHGAPAAPAVQHDMHQAPAQAAMEHAHADAMREHAEASRPQADAARERTAQAQAQEHNQQMAHTAPVQHAEAAMPHAAQPNREANINHAARPDVLAMHNQQPHAAQPAPAKPHPENHEANNHHADKREGQEHHG